MRIDNSMVDDTGKTTAEIRDSGEPTGFENVKNIIADRLHHVAEALEEKAADHEVQSSLARHGKQASEWLDQSSECVRQFDYERADARIREYVGQSPGRSLLIAGAVGLVIGAILRRR